MQTRFLALLIGGAAALALQSSFAGEGQPARTPREALQPFNSLVGSWKGTAKIAGGKADDFWIEKIAWGWQFKDKDAWLTIDFEKNKYFSKGTLHYVPEKNHYLLTLTTVNKEELAMKGELDDKGKILTVESEPDAKMDVYRMTVNMLHDGERYLYRVEKRKADKTRFTQVFNVGATKEGIAFAGGSTKPECVVSGGLGTQQVTYMGKTYYVCCSGCAAEFRAEPAKYVKEFEEKQAKKDKK